jgi:hypothetical protein
MNIKELLIPAPLYHIPTPGVSEQIKERSVVVSTKAGKMGAVMRASDDIT